MNSSADIRRAGAAIRLTEPGVIAVIRAPSAGVVVPLAAALVAGGVTALEITTSTPDYAAAIRAARSALGPRALVGAGTIMDAQAAETALAAGAEFIISPVFRPELVPLAHGAGCPVLLGAYTPTEAQRVHDSGADFVKLFPADALGPGYFRALRTPLPHLRLVPTGGVDVTNAAEFRRAGCVAIGVGGSLIRPEWVRDDDWPALTRAAAALVQTWSKG